MRALFRGIDRSLTPTPHAGLVQLVGEFRLPNPGIDHVPTTPQTRPNLIASFVHPSKEEIQTLELDLRHS